MGHLALQHLRWGLQAALDVVTGRTPSSIASEPFFRALKLELPSAEVDALLALAEAYRRETRVGDWIHSSACWADGDVQFQLQFSCKDLEFRMVWTYEPNLEPPPDTGSMLDAANARRSPPDSLNSAPGRLDVAIVLAGGLAVAGPISRLFRASGDRRLGRLRSYGNFCRLLDPYALPRLFLGEERPADSHLFCNELLLQLALWARKFGHMQPSSLDDNQLAKLFIEYAGQVVRPELRNSLDWPGAVDDVYVRLFHRAQPGRGLSAALGRVNTFRIYLRRALTCAMRRAKSLTPSPPSGGEFPQSIAEAAAQLGLSVSTVWRRCRGGGWPNWCREAWEQIRARHLEKGRWAVARQRLQGGRQDAGSGTEGRLSCQESRTYA
jgi:hypothetical protein